MSDLGPASLWWLEHMYHTAVWWHDIPGPVRRALHRRRLIKDDGYRTGCSTPGCKHPGRMVASARGCAYLNLKETP